MLFQLPPRWRCNTERLGRFLAALPAGYRYAFEFRDHSWHNDDVYALLRAHNAAFCAYHLDGFTSPAVATADFAYVRLHGPGGAYEGDYAKPTLRRWAERLRAWRDEGRDAYLYFDNDDSGYAVKNAITLKALLAEG